MGSHAAIEPDQVKYVCQILWTILAGWRISDGHREEDFVERTTQKI